MASSLKLSDFDYDLPKELIAQYPLKKRDEARLLVVNCAKATFEHWIFKDIIEYVKPDDVLVLNDTKVLPSRLIGRRVSGGKVEALLLRKKSGNVFEALLRPARLRLNEKIIFNNGSLEGVISSKNEVTFSVKDSAEVYHYGSMPLPPYIKRQANDADSIDYQTIYAKNEGAVASPTAGLHFTKELLHDIEKSGARLTYITLYVGYATFKPVKTETISEHVMDKEFYQIPPETIALLKSARLNKKRVVAVGTTSCRTLESYAATNQSEGWADLFIYPGYEFKLVDALITNFHLPRTTLYMLVCAFAGIELTRKAYQEAIEEKYRFYSYGDALLII